MSDIHCTESVKVRVDITIPDIYYSLIPNVA